MPKTKSQRNVYCREWRKRTYEEKRYNKPLRQFLELKYRDVLNEYNWFYKTLDEEDPTAKDLTKTRSFKNWKSRQLNCESSDDEAEGNVASPAESERDESEQVQPEPVESERDETEQVQPEPVESERDVLAAAAEGLFPPSIVDVNDLDIDRIDSIIQQVIDELEAEEGVRQILDDDNELLHPQYEDHDEGIGLDVQTELEAIVEPFDFNELEDFEF